MTSTVSSSEHKPMVEDRTQELRRPAGVMVFGVVLVALAAAMVFGVGVGPVGLSARDVVEIIGRGVLQQGWGEYARAEVAVVWDLRLPRVVLAAIVGAALAISGAALQGLFGNALADPGIVGVTSGASTGAIMAISLGLSAFGSWTVPAASFVMGLVVTFVIYVLAQPGKRGGTVQLLLVGIAVTAITGSFNGFMTYIADSDELESIVFWQMGSLNRASWESVAVGVPFLVVGLIVVLRLARPLDMLALGEKQARHLGLDVKRTRLLLVAATALLVAAAVATAGSIGFVGLVVPHIIRLVAGPKHRWLLPISAVGGALMLVLADIGARTLNPPTEIPIGLFTGLIGGPFFLWLLYRGGTRSGVR